MFAGIYFCILNVVTNKSLANINEFTVICFCLHFPGVNCSQILLESGYTVWRLPVRCEANLKPSLPHLRTEDIVTVKTEFDINTGNYRQALPNDGMP